MPVVRGVLEVLAAGYVGLWIWVVLHVELNGERSTGWCRSDTWALWFAALFTLPFAQIAYLACHLRDRRSQATERNVRSTRRTQERLVLALFFGAMLIVGLGVLVLASIANQIDPWLERAVAQAALVELGAGLFLFVLVETIVLPRRLVREDRAAAAITGLLAVGWFFLDSGAGLASSLRLELGAILVVVSAAGTTNGLPSRWRQFLGFAAILALVGLALPEVVAAVALEVWAGLVVLILTAMLEDPVKAKLEVNDSSAWLDFTERLSTNHWAAAIAVGLPTAAIAVVAVGLWADLTGYSASLVAEVASALLIFWAACAMLPVSNAIAAAWGECGECLESKLRAGELSWADIYRTAADVALQELRPRLLLANGLAHISTVPGRVAVQICKQHGTCTEEGTGAADVQRHGNRLQL